MRRIADILLRNWPLRLGAVLLATLLYTGLVLGQNVRTFNGVIPVEPFRPPAGAALLSDLDPIELVRYRAPIDVGVLSPDSFRASVDLSRVSAQPGGPAVLVPVTLIAVIAGVQIVDFQPREVEVRLDPVEVRELPVTVSLGSVAEGLNIGPPQTDPASVTIRGASSRVDAVSQVVARVTIDASALNVDRDIDLVAIDGNGNQVSNIEIDPERARIRIAVARELATRSLPVVPQLSGNPAFGYRISAITVEPLVVTVSGEEATVSRLQNAPTLPINVEGRTTDLEATIGLDLPQGVSVNGSDLVTVMLTIAEETGSRSFVVAVALESPPLEPQAWFPSQVTVIIAGPLNLLNALDAGDLIVRVGNSEQPGVHPVEVTAPPGLEVVSISPPEVRLLVPVGSP